MTADELEGSVLSGRYLVQSQIAQGGMSVIYRALDQTANEVVALKILKKELCNDERTMKRFFREGKALTQLKHSGVLSIRDVSVSESGQPFIIMEFIASRSLGAILEEQKVLNPDVAIPLFIEICDAMEYSHQNGIVHRDLKPDNIMIIECEGRLERPKVVDFGILKLDDSKHAVSQRLTDTGCICGSPAYMSPEQIKDDGVDHRSDIYALGCVLYRTLCGAPPFESDNAMEILFSHLRSRPRPLQSLKSYMFFYPSLEVIVTHALVKNKEHRYQSMGELKSDLQTFLARLEQEIAAGVSGKGFASLPPLPFARQLSAAELMADTAEV